MLEFREIAQTFSGVAIQEARDGPARFMRLSDLSDLKSGRAPSLAIGAEPGVARAVAIEGGDLIVGARGASTDICLAGRSVLGAFVSLDLYLVRPDASKVDSGFLAAFLELPGTQAVLASGKQGSGLARLPKDALDKLEIPLPPMSKQRLIAQLARSFRDEAELLRRLVDLNSILGREAVARAMRAAKISSNS